MTRCSALPKLFLIFTLFSVLISNLHAQKVTDIAFPLYAKAIELDTDRLVYSTHKITSQIDSTWEDGKLIEWSTANYSPNGNVIARCTYPQDQPGKQQITQFAYNATNVCIFSRNMDVVNGDTTYMMEKRSIKMDTVRGIYTYEIMVSFATGRADTTYSDFEWDFVDTKCRTNWSRLYVNRTLNYLVQRPGSDTIRWTLYSFHDADTLSKRILTGGKNMYDVDTVFNYLSPDLVTRAVFVNYRSTETKAWENGKLIEYYTYKDSVANFRVWKSTIYNMLKSDSVPEIVITMSDTMNVVCKNGMNVYIDHTPDTVKYLPLFEPPPPEPPLETIFPYRKAVPLGNGLTRLEYYNFRAGTIRPLFVILQDDRGVVISYQYGNLYIKRKVR